MSRSSSTSRMRLGAFASGTGTGLVAGVAAVIRQDTWNNQTAGQASCKMGKELRPLARGKMAVDMWRGVPYAFQQNVDRANAIGEVWLPA